MAIQYLKDKYGSTIGQIEIRSDGVQVLRDKYGGTLGQYNPRDNTTRDSMGAPLERAIY